MPSYCELEAITNNSIHLFSYFPMFTQDPEFVMATTNHFDPSSKIVKDTNGKKLISLDEDLFDTIFKCPIIEKYLISPLNQLWPTLIKIMTSVERI